MRNPRNNTHGTSGFTMIELLVVIAILGVLMFLSVRGVQLALGVADRARCASNLKQIAAAGLLYTADHDGFFPERGVLVNPWRAGGKPPSITGNPPPISELEKLPINPYVQNNYKLFRCPADTAARGGYWGKQPFYEKLGSSYYYNSFLGSSQNVLDGKEPGALYNLRVSQIQQPSRMVFFADQDARVVAYAGTNWETYALWWHAKKGTQLKANIAFVDGSVRFLDILPYDKADFSLYNK